MKAIHLFAVSIAVQLIAQPLVGQPTVPSVPLAARIVNADPSQYTVRQSVHAGAGPMNYMRLFNNTPGAVETNFQFVSRGVIEPGGGIGAHFHNTVEEMFIILDGEAEFTINGRTSLIRGPAGAPTVLGSSHAIYNPTDRPVEWMNINVTAVKGEYDAFDLNDPRVGVRLDSIPQFMVMRLDRDLLRPVTNMNGGSGTVQYRRALEPSVFRTPWAYVDHLLVPEGASTGGHRHVAVGEFYYVMAGTGVLHVGSESAPIRKGDGIPLHINEVHSVRNTGSEPLELMIVGIARDLAKNLTTVDVAQPTNQ